MSKPLQASTTAFRHLGAPRIIAFLRAALQTDGCIAINIANRELDEGNDLDFVFRAWEFPDGKSSTNSGTYIKAKLVGPNKYRINFGCHAGPLMGDGGEWLVTYDPTGSISAIEQTGYWIS